MCVHARLQAQLVMQGHLVIGAASHTCQPAQLFVCWLPTRCALGKSCRSSWRRYARARLANRSRAAAQSQWQARHKLRRPPASLVSVHACRWRGASSRSLLVCHPVVCFAFSLLAVFVLCLSHTLSPAFFSPFIYHVLAARLVLPPASQLPVRSAARCCCVVRLAPLPPTDD